MSAIAMPAERRPLWRRLIGFNLLTGIVGAVIGAVIGNIVGNAIHAPSLDYFELGTGQNDIAVLLGYLFGVIGFLTGLGFMNYPVRRMLGHPPSLAAHEGEGEGLARYFRLCTDHKVVANQYIIGIGVFFFIGGVNAMLIRTELLQPNVHAFGANQYLTLVGMHGSMMMGIITSAILGPFANYLVPLMIGTRRMAFPRIEAFTFWLVMAAGTVLVTTIFLGGFQTGWTGYQPLGDQGTAGYDAYIGFFALIGVSMCLLGFNLLATIITMRAPGMTWSRLPIFVWAVLATAILMLLAAPMLLAALLMGSLDRTVQTAFFVSGNGGSPYLWQNLFWVFGHPEVYIVAIPGFGIVLELLPVFTRKPLWGYRLAVAGMMGIAVLSFFVWQHHLFVSGINADLRPFYMFSTEMISLPDRVHLPVGDGHAVAGADSLHGADAVLPGLGVQLPHRRHLGRVPVRRSQRCHHPRQLLLDGPLPLHDHGRDRVHAVRGDLLLGPEDVRLQRSTRRWPSCISGRCSSPSTRPSCRCSCSARWACRVGWSPTRPTCRGSTTSSRCRRSCSGCRCSSSCSTSSTRIVFKREPAEANPWHSKSAEWQLPTPLPVHDFDRFPVFDPDPYPYGVGETNVALRSAGHHGSLSMEGSASAPTHPSIELEPPEWQPRAMWVGARMLCGAASFFFIAFVFAYFYLRSLDENHDWKIGHNINPSLGLGVAIVIVLRAQRGGDAAVGHQPGAQAAGGRGGDAARAAGRSCCRWWRGRRLGFGPASGGYASVYVGWTGCYTVFMLLFVYWIETQVATVWRRRRDGVEPTTAHVLDAADVDPRRAARVLVLVDLLRRQRRDPVRHPLPPVVDGFAVPWDAWMPAVNG